MKVQLWSQALETKTYRVDSLDDLVAYLRDGHPQTPQSPRRVTTALCPTCRTHRRVTVTGLYKSGDLGIPIATRSYLSGTQRFSGGIPLGDSQKRPSSTSRGFNYAAELLPQMTPSLWLFKCNECDALLTALVHAGPREPELAVFCNRLGGLKTEHTPEAVAYYLDQASRAQSVGALSAAVVMYRAALEHLLLGEGYNQPMCGPKVNAVESDRASGTGRAWVRNIDPQVLRFLKQLGDGAVHTNGGDVSKQAAIDGELLKAVTAAFAILLREVYERPHEDAAIKAQLAEVAKALK